MTWSEGVKCIFVTDDSRKRLVGEVYIALM